MNLRPGDFVISPERDCVARILAINDKGEAAFLMYRDSPIKNITPEEKVRDIEERFDKVFPHIMGKSMDYIIDMIDNEEDIMYDNDVLYTHDFYNNYYMPEFTLYTPESKLPPVATDIDADELLFSALSPGAQSSFLRARQSPRGKPHPHNSPPLDTRPFGTRVKRSLYEVARSGSSPDARPSDTRIRQSPHEIPRSAQYLQGKPYPHNSPPLDTRSSDTRSALGKSRPSMNFGAYTDQRIGPGTILVNIDNKKVARVVALESDYDKEAPYAVFLYLTSTNPDDDIESMVDSVNERYERWKHLSNKTVDEVSDMITHAAYNAPILRDALLTDYLFGMEGAVFGIDEYEIYNPNPLPPVATDIDADELLFGAPDMASIRRHLGPRIDPDHMMSTVKNVGNGMDWSGVMEYIGNKPILLHHTLDDSWWVIIAQGLEIPYLCGRYKLISGSVERSLNALRYEISRSASPLMITDLESIATSDMILYRYVDSVPPPAATDIDIDELMFNTDTEPDVGDIIYCDRRATGRTYNELRLVISSNREQGLDCRIAYITLKNVDQLPYDEFIERGTTHFMRETRKYAHCIERLNKMEPHEVAADLNLPTGLRNSIGYMQMLPDFRVVEIGPPVATDIDIEKLLFTSEYNRNWTDPRLASIHDKRSLVVSDVMNDPIPIPELAQAQPYDSFLIETRAADFVIVVMKNNPSHLKIIETYATRGHTVRSVLKRIERETTGVFEKSHLLKGKIVASTDRVYPLDLNLDESFFNYDPADPADVTFS